MSDRDQVITDRDAMADTTGPTERRKRQRSSSGDKPAPPKPPQLDDYAQIVTRSAVDELRYLARPLRNTTVKMVNGT